MVMVLTVINTKVTNVVNVFVGAMDEGGSGTEGKKGEKKG